MKYCKCACLCVGGELVQRTNLQCRILIQKKTCQKDQVGCARIGGFQRFHNFKNFRYQRHFSEIFMHDRAPTNLQEILRRVKN